jgi:hypothetical protein
MHSVANQVMKRELDRLAESVLHGRKGSVGNPGRRGLSPFHIQALAASLMIPPGCDAVSDEELSRVARDLLNGGLGPVGNVSVRHRQVGGVAIRSRMVGAPALMEDTPNPNPVVYGAQVYKEGENTYMGLGRTVIPAGTNRQQVTVKPQRSFAAARLTNPSNVQGLLINQVSIQNTLLFAGDDGVPVELFSEVATNPEFDWPTIQPETGIIFTVSNPTLGDLVFSGALYGTQVRI